MYSIKRKERASRDRFVVLRKGRFNNIHVVDVSLKEDINESLLQINPFERRLTYGQLAEMLKLVKKAHKER